MVAEAQQRARARAQWHHSECSLRGKAQAVVRVDTGHSRSKKEKTKQKLGTKTSKAAWSGAMGTKGPHAAAFCCIGQPRHGLSLTPRAFSLFVFKIKLNETMGVIKGATPICWFHHTLGMCIRRQPYISGRHLRSKGDAQPSTAGISIQWICHILFQCCPEVRSFQDHDWRTPTLHHHVFVFYNYSSTLHRRITTHVARSKATVQHGLPSLTQ